MKGHWGAVSLSYYPDYYYHQSDVRLLKRNT